MVAYVPDWESLPDALKRVIATDMSEEEAKRDLCRAVADGKIDVRVTIASSHRGRGGQVFSDGNVRVPPHLDPKELDWVHSCPLKPWLIGPRLVEHYLWPGGWNEFPIELIEVATADVTKILCGGEADNYATGLPAATIKHRTEAIRALTQHLNSLPMAERKKMKRPDAKAWCEAEGFHLTGRGFQDHVWPKARENAGLPRKAGPGRKPKL